MLFVHQNIIQNTENVLAVYKVRWDEKWYPWISKLRFMLFVEFKIIPDQSYNYNRTCVLSEFNFFFGKNNIILVSSFCSTKLSVFILTSENIDHSYSYVWIILLENQAEFSLVMFVVYLNIRISCSSLYSL